MTIEDRLNKELKQAESKIKSLKRQVTILEKDAVIEKDWRWQLHEEFTQYKFAPDLPYPRMEMRFSRDKKQGRKKHCWRYVKWVYGLAFKHYSQDKENRELLFVPMGLTGSSTSYEDWSNGNVVPFSHWREYGSSVIQKPRRDIIHMMYEARILGNLPMYMICEEMEIAQDIKPDNEFLDDMMGFMSSK